MSRSFCLAAVNARRFVNLGARGRRTDWEFEGPVVWIDEERYRLPAALLDTLVERFRERHGEANVVILPIEELLESEAVWSEEEEIAEVGGDGDGDVSLSEYLPELAEQNMRERIRSGDALGVDR